MGLSVRERGDCVSTFRWIEVRLMETLASWVPTTPEMEVKLLFGAHIWDAAQHADWLGKRTHELRLAMHHGTEPSSEYVALLAELAETAETPKRVVGFYDAVLPDLLARFSSYLERVDQLLDAPTLRILDRITSDVGRMTAESRSLRDELPALGLVEGDWLSGFRNRLAAMGDVVQYRPRRSTEAQPA